MAHIYADPDAAPEDRCESAAVCTAAAFFSDRVDEAAALLADWSVRTPPRSTKLQCFLANQQAQICLYRGEPEQTRYLFLSAPHETGIPGMESSRSFGDWLVGMSYLAEGQVRLAEGVLRTALAHAESVVGRRSQVAVMLATALASALWERDQPEAVASLLANRLDVIERLAAPEMVASAYTLRARWLALHGQEHRAYDLLESLHSLGERRHMPRLCLVSLAEQIRMHALRHHSETCAALYRRLETVGPGRGQGRPGPAGNAADHPYGIAQAYHALAQRDPDAMLAQLNRIAPLADRLRRHHDSIRIKLLRALALKRAGEDGRPLFKEANSLAEAYGLTRVVVDTHPELADWAPRRAQRCPGAAPRRPADPAPGHDQRPADGQGGRNPAPAGQQHVQQADWPDPGRARRNHQVAPEEPVRQARGRLAPTCRAPGAPDRPARRRPVRRPPGALRGSTGDHRASARSDRGGRSREVR